jgi:mannose-6-phosphate isomerase-like protein (cupin superfamily)
MGFIHESDVSEKALPGRYLRWIVNEQDGGLTSEYCSCCIMRVDSGKTVKPAHRHPKGEELIYFIQGNGEVYVDGVITPVREGSAVLLEQGCIHMVSNTGDTEMKAACFYAPKTNLDEYEFHPEIEFNQGVKKDV